MDLDGIANRVAESYMRQAFRLPVPPYLSPRGQKRMDRSIQTIEDALEAKQIWNMDFKDLKGDISRAFEDSRERIKTEYWTVSGWDDIPWDERREIIMRGDWRPDDQTPFEVRGLKKFLRGLAKYDGEMKGEFQGWAEAWLAYQDALVALKPFVVKGRKPNPNAKPKDVYVAPPMTSGGQRKVEVALRKVVDAEVKGLIDARAGRYMKAAKRFLDEREPTETPYEFFARDPEMRGAVHMMVEVTEGNPMMSRSPKTYALKRDAAAVAKGRATREIDDIVKRYLYKNGNKIGSVVERKGNLDTIKVAHGNLRGWGFQGELVCVFTDGTQFTVRNKVVFKMTGRGTDFVQFPTTFHNVIWPDGKRSAMVPEKQMNEEWAKA